MLATPARTIFVDLDGVLADFDRHCLEQFGMTVNRDIPDPSGLWRAINKHGEFFSTIPLMPDAWTLWNGVLAFGKPKILTGMPMIRKAEEQKREWVRKHFGDVRTICCYSREKSKYCTPGDILIDDWSKYQKLWEDAGGIFIKHEDAQTSLVKLDEVWQA